MDKNKTILLTGAAGFIGSYLLGYLNKKGYENIIIVDDFSRGDKKPNYETKKFAFKIERENLFDWLKINHPRIALVFHFGARTDTTEFDYSVHEKLNVEYSKNIWKYCAEEKVPLVYASSAATYGSGELGYKDDHDIIYRLKPLNPYGVSKNEFDKWLIEETRTPLAPPLKLWAARGRGAGGLPFWVGLKFFNVYGPNEYHKGRMASMIFHGYNQIQDTGKVRLFKSHKPEYKNGEQLRDFIYVKDVADVCYWLMQNAVPSGLYNLGTGKARSFNGLVRAVFSSLSLSPKIEYIEIPEDIRDKYQYFTEAKMEKLRDAGYCEKFYSLEEGINDYVKNYLSLNSYY